MRYVSGKDGQDAPGTWRIPTLREGSLIMIYYKELEATATQDTDCKAFALSDIATTYWLATENTTSSQAWSMTIYPDATRVKYKSVRDLQGKLLLSPLHPGYSAGMNYQSISKIFLSQKPKSV